MKKLTLLALLISATVGVTQSASSSLTGKWKIHQNIAGNEGDGDCTFTQTASDLSGTCTVGEQGSRKLTGKVDGNKVSWSYASEYNGTALTVKYSGTVSAEKIAGDVTVDPYGVSGDFTATLAK